MIWCQRAATLKTVCEKILTLQRGSQAIEGFLVVGLGGVEPPTSRLSGWNRMFGTNFFRVRCWFVLNSAGQLCYRSCYRPWDRRSAALVSTLILVDHAPLHHEVHALQLGDVCEWIFRHGDDVGIHPWCDPADAIGPAKEFRSGRSG
jgi:hypothetical protein